MQQWGKTDENILLEIQRCRNNWEEAMVIICYKNKYSDLERGKAHTRQIGQCLNL
jgi:hypothetical protein